MFDFTSAINWQNIALTANTLKAIFSKLMSDEIGVLLSKLGVKDNILIDGFEMILYTR